MSKFRVGDVVRTANGSLYLYIEGVEDSSGRVLAMAGANNVLVLHSKNKPDWGGRCIYHNVEDQVAAVVVNLVDLAKEDCTS
jgi:hypothetical protein